MKIKAPKIEAFIRETLLINPDLNVTSRVMFDTIVEAIAKWEQSKPYDANKSGSPTA